MLKLGYKASAEQFGPVELLKFGCIAEEVGFDSVFISDHFQPWRHTGGHAPYSLAWLGALGAKTSRIVMGTSVLTPTFRYHPSIVAQAFGTLGCLFPGRVILGIGSGEALNETPATGMPWPEAKERLGRLRESVTLMRTLFKEERVTFDGQYYKTVNATIYDRPDAPIPIYIGAGGPQMAKYVGKAGDGFICTSGKAWTLYTEQLLPALAAGLEEAGRAPDRERALNDTKHWAALALSAEEKHSVGDPLEMEKLSDALPVERAASRWIVSNDPDEHVSRMKPYLDMGFTHLVFHAPGPDQERFLRLYGEQVLPRLRQMYGG
jgi:coenzyme F420-dependent glucose-6-phosphate dehydrogenase